MAANQDDVIPSNDDFVDSREKAPIAYPFDDLVTSWTLMQEYCRSQGLPYLDTPNAFSNLVIATGSFDP